MGTGVLSILDIKFRSNPIKVVTFLEFGLNDGTAESGQVLALLKRVRLSWSNPGREPNRKLAIFSHFAL
jgi:hypothetical protein